MKKTNKNINENLVPLMIWVPVETVAVDIEAVLMDDENYKVYRAKQHMGRQEVYDAMIDGNDYDSEHAIYCLKENTDG